jgi:hypothetical protein
MRWRLTPSRARPGWLTLIGPRDDDFKADLMERVPKHLREYCPPPSIFWRVHESQQRYVQSLIVLHSDPEELAKPTLAEVLALAAELEPAEEPAELRDALALAVDGVEQLMVRGTEGSTLILVVLGGAS